MVKARGVWDAISTVIVTAAAVTMLGVYLYDREHLVTEGPEPEVANWEDWAASGIRVGPERAPMVIATFIDFVCPYCKALAPVLDSVATEFNGDVALEFHHFPLKSHEFALPAAISAECADRQGRFTQMYAALYAKIDSIEQKPWSALATEAGVADLAAFESCTELPSEEFRRIGEGLALAGRLGVVGTPTVYVNGRLFNGRSVAAFRGMANELGLGR